jgi:hypothetical protein
MVKEKDTDVVGTQMEHFTKVFSRMEKNMENSKC